MGNIPKKFLDNRIIIKKKVISQNNKHRASSHGKKKSISNIQQEQSSGDDGDDGPSGSSTNFQENTPHDKMTLLPNAGPDDSAPRKGPLTIKSPSEINLSSLTSKPLLTVADLASMLEISRPTIYRLVEDRKIPFLKLGSLIRFTKANIEQFLNERQINPIL